MEFDREYWEGMTRGALYEHISKLEDQVEELEEFAKHEYISMKNWQEEKANLHDNVEELKRELKIANIFAVSRRKVIAELQAKAEDADRQRSILQINLDAETTGGNVLDRENERLTAKIEELEQAIGYVMRAWYYDRPHLPWSIHQLEKAYPKWKDRYPHYKVGG